MEKVTCPKCDGGTNNKKRWGVVTYTCTECGYVWYEKKKARCPKCSSKKVGFDRKWGENLSCFNCGYKIKVGKEEQKKREKDWAEEMKRRRRIKRTKVEKPKEEPQYYYEGDVDEYKKGLIEKIREVL